MPNFLPVDRALKYIAVDFEAQILPGTFERYREIALTEPLNPNSKQRDLESLLVLFPVRHHLSQKFEKLCVMVAVSGVA